jgi:hypothetical protein
MKSRVSDCPAAAVNSFCEMTKGKVMQKAVNNGVYMFVLVFAVCGIRGKEWSFKKEAPDMLL